MNNHIYISARDVAGDTRLNYELDKWFWMPYRKGFALRGMTMLFLLACFPSVSQAETCTPTPDCKSLGYTETSCPDGGGVKCPWNTSLMYCCKKCEEQPPCMSCYVGWILNSDMTCSAEKASGKTPIGVISQQTITTEDAIVKCQALAFALKDISSSVDWSTGNSQCDSYSIEGISGWHLPTIDEFRTVYNNIRLQNGLTAVNGTQFSDVYYWTSSFHYFNNTNYGPYDIRPVSATTTHSWSPQSFSVRPVLAF